MRLTDLAVQLADNGWTATAFPTYQAFWEHPWHLEPLATTPWATLKTVDHVRPPRYVTDAGEVIVWAMDPAVVGRRHLIIVILDANGNVLRSTHTDSGKRISLADLADFGQRNSVAGRAERAAWVAEHEAQSAARRRELRDTEDRLEVFAGDLRQRLTDAGIGPEHVELSHDGATVKLPTWALLTLLP